MSIDEHTALRSQVETFRSERHALDLKVSELESSHLESKHLLNNRETELEHLKKHSTWLQSELEKKCDELRSAKSATSEQIKALQSELAKIQTEKQGVDVSYSHLQTVYATTKGQLAESERKREEENLKAITNEKKLVTEMQGLKKLSALYESKAADLGKRNEEIEALLTDAETKLQKFNETVVQNSTQAEKKIQDLQVLAEERQSRIEKLEAELNVLNEQFGGMKEADVLGVLSETAAASSKLQKSGKTFTEVVCTGSLSFDVYLLVFGVHRSQRTVTS